MARASLSLGTDVDTTAAAREVEQLRLHADRSEWLQSRVIALLERNVHPFELVRLPRARNGLAFRAQLSDPYWDLLHIAISGGR